jgi:transposase-like protein
MVAPYFADRSPHPGMPDDRGKQRVPASFIPDTNAIESLNARFRQSVRHRSHFPNEQAALKVLYLVAMQKKTGRRNPTGQVFGWKIILNALTIHYSDRLAAINNP